MSDDPGFLNEQRVVALAVAPSIVNIVNEHEDSGDDFILTG